MTKERLEELIKAKGFVYFNNLGTQMKLDFGDYSNCRICADKLIVTFGLGGYIKHELKNLFETKEQAEWALKTVTERTERFEPPMWGDIENYYDFRFIVNNKCIRLYVRKDTDCIIIFTEDDDRIFEASATKEYYEKACEIVRDLFKGESNGKEEVK